MFGTREPTRCEDCGQVIQKRKEIAKGYYPRQPLPTWTIWVGELWLKCEASADGFHHPDTGEAQ